MPLACMPIPIKRNSFQTPSILLVLVIAAVMVSATNTAFADQRNRGNSPRFSPSFNSSFNSNFRNHVTPVNRPASRFNNRFDQHYNRDVYSNFNRNSRRNDFYNNRFGNSFRSRFDNFGSSYRYRPSRYDGWLVSLNLGSGYSSAWYGSGVGIGSNYYGAGLGGSPFIPYRNRTSVIVSQPTVVYVNDSSRVTGQVLQESVNVRPARSLLRDIHGDCFERTYNRSGRETRIQLPASACNF